MTVRELNRDDMASYQKLVEKCGTIFNRLDWVSLFDGKIRILGVFNKNDELIGGMTVSVRRILWLKMLMAQPLSSATGPFYRSFASNGVKKLEERRSVVEALAKYIEDERYCVVSIPMAPENFDMLPFIWRDYKVVTRYTYRIDLTVSSY